MDLICSGGLGQVPLTRSGSFALHATNRFLLRLLQATAAQQHIPVPRTGLWDCHNCRNLCRVPLRNTVIAGKARHLRSAIISLPTRSESHKKCKISKLEGPLEAPTPARLPQWQRLLITPEPNDHTSSRRSCPSSESKHVTRLRLLHI